MANPVEILFATPNLSSVQSAIGSVAASLDKLANSGRSAAERQTRASTKGFADTAKAAERSAREEVKAAEKAAREKARLRNQYNNVELKEIAKAERERISLRNAGNRLEVKEYQKTEAEKTRTALAEGRKRQSEAKRELAASARDARQQSAGIHDIDARNRRWGNVGRNAVTNALGTAGKIAGVAASVAGGFSIADSLGKGISQEAKAGIIFRGAAKKGDVQDPKEVHRLGVETALATGGTVEGTLDLLDSLVVKTGDLGAAKAMLMDIAKTAAATGTEFGFMGEAAGEVFNQLKDPKETAAVMRTLAGQGRAGAIDMRDLAVYGGRLAAASALYTGDKKTNIESFGAIAQVAKEMGGATGPAEATEAAQRLGSDMIKHADRFKALGVDVFTDKTQQKLRAPEELIIETIMKTKGDLTKTKDLFNERSYKAITGAQVAYSNAGGGVAGKTAMEAQFAKYRVAGLTEKDVEEGVAARQAETQAKLNNAMTILVEALNTELLPVLPPLIASFVKIIPAIEKVVSFFAGNSIWQNIGYAMTTAVVGSVTKAGAGMLVEAAIVKLLTRIGGGAAAATAAEAAAKAAAAAAAALTGTGAATGTATALGTAATAEAAALGGTGATALGGGAAAVGGGAAGVGMMGAAGMALAGIAGVTAIGGGAVYGLMKVSQKLGENRVSDSIAANATTPEEQKKKLADLQMLLALGYEQQSTSARVRNAEGTIVNTDKLTPREAGILGDTTAAAANKKMVELVVTIELLKASLEKAAGAAESLAMIDPKKLTKPVEPGSYLQGFGAK